MMPALDIDDGYTLDAVTSPQDKHGNPLPRVAFTYRPALPDALATLRLKTRRADTGSDEVAAAAEFVASHVVKWDVKRGGRPAPVTADVVRKLPEPILDEIVTTVGRWSDRPHPTPANPEPETPLEAAAKN